MVEDQEIYIEINKNLDDLEIKYRWNCEDCDTNFVVYNERLPLEKSAELEVRAYKKGKLYGEPIFQKIENHLGLYSIVTYKTMYNDWYKGGEIFGLVDGKLGSENFRDGNWQGFWGVPIEIEIDLGEQKMIRYIGAHFFYYSNAWIFLPKTFAFSHSADGVNWTQCYVQNEGKFVVIGGYPDNSFTVLDSEIESPKLMRYLKIKIESIGKVPNWHEAAGQDSWLFIDEIILR